MAVYAIGDLQGCYDSLQRLLEKLSFDFNNDTLWLTGDLVNRGPKSLKTLRFVHNNRQQIRTVLGNHDFHLLKSSLGKPRNAPLDLQRILRADDCDELLAWLREQPLVHFDEAMNTALVHAGIPPGWSIATALKRSQEVSSVLSSDRWPKFISKLYGNEPSHWSGRLKGAARLRYIVNALTRMRMLETDGSLNLRFSGPPQKAGKRLIPWFDVRKRRARDTRIVFGHWSSLGLHIEKNLISLDTGCVWGRRLTAIRLDKESAPIKVNCACESR